MFNIAKIMTHLGNKHKERFEMVIADLKKGFNKTKNMFVSCKKITDERELLITVVLRKNSELNKYSNNIVFTIMIDKDFPESEPVVKCLTNFAFPTIFDNRNLLYSVIMHNWIKDNSVNEIVEKLAGFVARIGENSSNRVLVYYGDYQIDHIYDINDFSTNAELIFSKVKQRVKKANRDSMKERYIVLTDIYFLLFDPVPENKNLAKLLFWGDIKQLSSARGNSNSSDTVTLDWKNENNELIIQFTFTFPDSAIKDFMDQTSRRILKIKENFKIFQDDINKPNKGEEDGNANNMSNIALLIKYKEELLEKKQTVNVISELMNLYQKAVEILSAEENPDFEIYLNKLHKMLNDKEIQDLLEEDKKNSKETAKKKTNENIMLRLSEAALSINENESISSEDGEEEVNPLV